MTSETQTREILHRTADQLVVGPPPVDALLASTRRRRRRIAVVAAGVAAAGVVAAVALINPGSGSDSEPIPPTQTITPPDVRPVQRPVAIVGAKPACAANDGPAMLVTIEANRRYDVHVVLSVGDNVIGKLPTKIRPGERNRVIVAISEATDADDVTVQVFGLGMAMDESLLAERPGVPLRPAPICG